MERIAQGNTLRKALPLLFAATCSVDLEELPLDPHQVKASYLFNLLRFVEWPDDIVRPGGNLNLHIHGADSLSAFRTLHGARVGNRTICVRRIKSLTTAQLKKCHVLFISGDVPVISIPIAPGMLTVGETDAFTACGGIVKLLLIDGRIRFQLNEEIAQACGLVIDPRILSLGSKEQRLRVVEKTNRQPVTQR